jgi:hypothetical protein
VIDAQVTAHADQPGLEIGAPIERVQRLENLEEDVLRQILGFVVAAGELVGDVEHLAAVLTHDLFPGPLIAAQAALDQRINRISGNRRRIRHLQESGTSVPSPNHTIPPPAQLDTR